MVTYRPANAHGDNFPRVKKKTVLACSVSIHPFLGSSKLHSLLVGEINGKGEVTAADNISARYIGQGYGTAIPGVYFSKRASRLIAGVPCS